MEVITLCGSMKFKTEIMREAERLTKEGNVVFTPSIFDNIDPGSISDALHKIYDEIHRYKMSISDYVYIVNVNGYIGEDTDGEIRWCLDHKIPVRYMDKVHVNTLHGYSSVDDLQAARIVAKCTQDTYHTIEEQLQWILLHNGNPGGISAIREFCMDHAKEIVNKPANELNRQERLILLIH